MGVLFVNQSQPKDAKSAYAIFSSPQFKECCLFRQLKWVSFLLRADVEIGAVAQRNPADGFGGDGGEQYQA